MTTIANIPTLSETISKDDQDVHFTAVLNYSGKKVRIRIRSNSHKFQSWALAEVWGTELRWNEIATVQHGAMFTREGLCYSPVWESRAHFIADATTLMRDVANVLN